MVIGVGGIMKKKNIAVTEMLAAIIKTGTIYFLHLILKLQNEWKHLKTAIFGKLHLVLKII